MKTFLIVAGAVGAGLFLFLALVWWCVQRELRQVGQLLASMGAAAPPPFRVSLVPAESEPAWSDPTVIAAASGALEELGYRRIEDYVIPEMGDLPGRAFLHEAERLYAVLYDHPAAGIICDIACALSAGMHLTATSAPESGLDQPPRSRIVHLPRLASDSDDIRRLHERVLAEAGSEARRAVAPEAFVSVFEANYIEQMDWHIERRGPTAEEVRRIAQLLEEPEPDADEIQMVQAIWLGAIEEFVDEQVRKAYLAGTALSASEWESQRDRLFMVHEYCSLETRLDWLAWEIVGEEEDGDGTAHGGALSDLQASFEGRTFRDGFRTAQELLPAARRYEAIGSVSEPWAADLYLSPDDPDDS